MIDVMLVVLVLGGLGRRLDLEDICCWDGGKCAV